MKYKCIIFDCDGVLVDSEAISTKVLIEMAQELGVTLDLSEAIDKFSGRSLKSSFEFIEDIAKIKLPSSFEKEYRSKTFEAFKKDLQPVKGIHELINGLKVPFCVASSGPLDKIKLNLTTTLLIDKFGDKIYSAYEIGKWKPDPGVFLYAASKMGFDPKECAVIEDSIAGIRAGISGGFDVYAYCTDNKKAQFENEGAIVFHCMDELLGLIT